MHTPPRRYPLQADLYVDFTNGESSLRDLVITRGGPYLRKLVIWIRSHLWLLLLGITSEFIYYYYLLHNFPVTGYYYRLDTMGGITGFTHTGFLIYLMAFGFLFMLFGFAWWETRSFKIVLRSGLFLALVEIFALTTTFVYPVISIDLFNYIVQSLVLVQYHTNPIVTSPAQFPKDPLMQLAEAILTPHPPMDRSVSLLTRCQLLSEGEISSPHSCFSNSRFLQC